MSGRLDRIQPGSLPMTASQPTPPGTGEPVDVRPMLVVHQALLREFHMTGWAVASGLPWDHERAVVLNGHLTFLLDLLHHHHAGEDKLLWPKLLSRAPADTVPIIDLMQAQHERLATLMTQCRPAAAPDADAKARPPGLRQARPPDLRSGAALARWFARSGCP
jgi:hypothetical protein